MGINSLWTISWTSILTIVCKIAKDEVVSQAYWGLGFGNEPLGSDKNWGVLKYYALVIVISWKRNAILRLIFNIAFLTWLIWQKSFIIISIVDETFNRLGDKSTLYKTLWVHWIVSVVPNQQLNIKISVSFDQGQSLLHQWHDCQHGI